MLYKKSPPRGFCRSASSWIATVTLLTPIFVIAENVAPAPSVVSAPEAMVISASRFPRKQSEITSTVTPLDPRELTDEGLLQLRDALNFSPGVISLSTAGQTGAIGSLFIRGTTTAQSQFVIDGMRLGDSNTQLGNILGGSRTYDFGKIEILRGAQGAAYGGGSLGGVLWAETPHGKGKPSGALTLESGAFDSSSGRSMFQGEAGPISYYLSGGVERTDNDGENMQFHQANAALRVEGKVNDLWEVGTTYRVIDSRYNNEENSIDHLDTSLTTVYATGKISDIWTSKFQAGYYQEFYDSDSTFGNYGTDLRQGNISTVQQIALQENLRLLTGLYVEDSSFKNTLDVDKKRERYGAHFAVEWDLMENFTSTAALRWEDYDSYGDEFTWRVGSVYNIQKTGTSIRAGLGTSFRAPNYQELYGYQYGPGNLNLDAEKSVGWEIGLDQKISRHHTLGVTWFQNHISEEISNTSPPVNISGQSTTNGLEAGLRGSWLEQVSYKVAWTYLHESLSGQPRNAASAAVDWKPVEQLLIGTGISHLSAHTWGASDISSYTILRIYSSYLLTENIKVHARLENALNENYQLFNYQSPFYSSTVQGAGTGLYAGITFLW